MKKILGILFILSLITISCDNGSGCTDDALGNSTTVFTNKTNATIALTVNGAAKALSPGEVYEVDYLATGVTLSFQASSGNRNWSDSWELESCKLYDVTFK